MFWSRLIRKVATRNILITFLVSTCTLIYLPYLYLAVGMSSKNYNLAFTANGFQSVAHRTHRIYSAFFDNRVKKLGPLIRIIGFMKRDDKEPIYCKIYYKDKRTECLPYPVLLEDLDPLNKQYRHVEFAYLCRLPSPEVPVAVTLTASRSCAVDKNILPVQNERPEERREFGVCISAPSYEMYRGDAQRIFESIEMNRILGADAIHFHNESMSRDLLRPLMKHVQDGLVTLQHWRPGDFDLHTFAQTLSINECLYRNMYKYQYLVFCDIDELIVPRDHMNWSSMMSKIHKDDVGAYIFKNMWFYDESTKEKSKQMKKSLHPYGTTYPLPKIVTHRLRHKRPLPVPHYTKYIVNPRSVISLTVHRVFDLLPGFHNYTVPEHIALLHHFKARGRIKTKDLHLDPVTDKYVPELLKVMHQNFYGH